MVEVKNTEPVEILPENIGELPSSETPRLLERAAVRLEITRPKTEFWEGMKENLRGAAGFLEAQKKQLGSKALRAVIGASLVSTMLSACSSPQAPELPPTEQPTISTPTETPTEVSTEVPTPTENPNVISSQEYLANCPVKLEIDVPLQGKALVGGEVISLDYPNLHSKISIGLDESLINRGKDPNSETAKLKWLPYNNLVFGDTFQEETGIDPKVQIETDVWYIIYKAWQHDNNNADLQERKNISFTDFLQMANNGEDISISHWVITEKNKIYPDEEDKIDPTKINLVMIFTDYTKENGFLYDKSSNSLIAINYLSSEPGTDPDSYAARSNGYPTFVISFSALAFPTDLQKAVGTGSQDQIRVRASLDETYSFIIDGNYFQKAREGKLSTLPFNSISPGSN